MKMNGFAAAGAVGWSVLVAGCGIGNAPEPMASKDVKGAVEKLTPQQQIDWYMRSPMPQAEKQKKIDEIRQKYGLSGGNSVPANPGEPAMPSK